MIDHSSFLESGHRQQEPSMEGPQTTAGPRHGSPDGESGMRPPLRLPHPRPRRPTHPYDPPERLP